MVVLATKLYVAGEARERALDGLTSMVADRLDGLDADADVGVREDGFPSVTVTGPDATAARNLLAEEFGALTPDRTDGEVAVGTLESWDDSGFELDVGFGERVRIPADGLGLGPGDPDQIRTRYGLVQHLPLRYVAGESPRLAGEQRDRLYDWTRGEGRVNVNSATRAEVRATVNRAGHADDIVTVERLGLLEQSIVCREGTDPPGLLASIGRHLPSELLAVVP
jgi:hypothetical protein